MSDYMIGIMAMGIGFLAERDERFMIVGFPLLILGGLLAVTRCMVHLDMRPAILVLIMIGVGYFLGSSAARL